MDSHSLSSCSEIWIAKDEYDESGPDIVHTNAFKH